MFKSTPIDEDEFEALKLQLQQFDTFAKDGVLDVPENKGQVVVRAGSKQDKICEEASEINASLFVTQIDVGGQKFNQYVTNGEVFTQQP